MIDDDKIEGILYKIIEGETRIEVSDGSCCTQKILYVKEPTVSDKLKASRIYEKRFNQAFYSGVCLEKH